MTIAALRVAVMGAGVPGRRHAREFHELEGAAGRGVSSPPTRPADAYR
jgi:hypothetical protein